MCDLFVKRQLVLHMSALLWKFFLEDDVESFRQLLEEAVVSGRTTAQKSVNLQQTPRLQPAGSPEVSSKLSTTPCTPRTEIVSSFNAAPSPNSFSDVVLTKADINRRDSKGCTLLHYISSSTLASARDFATLLLSHPHVDLYIQDLESGWTALHRAFYFGNVSVARAILTREFEDSTGQGSAVVAVHAANLIRIKDREDLGPFDMLTATIKDRTLHHELGSRIEGSAIFYLDDESSSDGGDDGDGGKSLVNAIVDVEGDQLFTFGSNKNMTLGLGNEDDRQFPERVKIRRPEHLYRRFYREQVESQVADVKYRSSAFAEALQAKLRQVTLAWNLPSVIRAKPTRIQDVQMSKFHTALLTRDTVSNLYMCGHGRGGRLGTGNEKTQYQFVCIEDFGPTRKKIVDVALGQDHTLAVTDQGELFVWGRNDVGQLGLGMSKDTVNTDEELQLVPKQVFGPLKRETVLGVAASRIHSVVHTTSEALFTFGKNDGQLGIIDANAASLEVQSIPRRVAASRFSAKIRSVVAIDRATVCLLEDNEVYVLANYGIVKVQFPLEGFYNYFLKKSFLATRYDGTPNTIVKVAGGGNTICALTTAGEIFSVDVNQVDESGPRSSTTKPNKIRNALSAPSRVWTLKKGFMAAKDVAVDDDGSIILTTRAGSAWRRVRRSTSTHPRMESRSKEFKFSRVPGMTRVTAVRASGFGAYSAIRQECDVTQAQMLAHSTPLWVDLCPLLPFVNISSRSVSIQHDPMQRTEQVSTLLGSIIATLAASKDVEKDLGDILTRRPNETTINYDCFVSTTTSNITIPAHSFILAGRSRVLREAFAVHRESGSLSAEMFSMSYAEHGKTHLVIQGVDFLVLIELILFCYTDQVVAFWLRTRVAPHMTYRYRQVRMETMRLALRLEITNLEAAARRMLDKPAISLDKDLELAIQESSYFQSGNAVVQLSDGEIHVHADLLSRRCPFFRGLFQGHAGTLWLANRRSLANDDNDTINVDLTHVDMATFRIIMRHMYGDTGEELFDDTFAESLDDFLDVVLEVLSVANELMLDALAGICQVVIGRYGMFFGL